MKFQPLATSRKNISRLHKIKKSKIIKKKPELLEINSSSNLTQLKRERVKEIANELKNPFNQ